MRNRPANQGKCQICGRPKSTKGMMPVAMIRPSLLDTIRQDHPDISVDGYICLEDLNSFRAKHIEKMIEADRGEISLLEEDVVRSLTEHELLAKNLNLEYETKFTLGQRLADRIAIFGGSWTFIIIFMGFFVVWMLINSLTMYWRPPDPYPYILLNLILSCMAAIQAPVIMMSQNRQEAKDRLRAENDYRVNLQAELEIRHLNEKMDHLVINQWQRLLEIQQIQMEIMQAVRPGK